MVKLLVETKIGSKVATVTEVTDGYGDTSYRVKVLNMNGGHVEGDVLFLKSYKTEKAARKSAQAQLEMWA